MTILSAGSGAGLAGLRLREWDTAAFIKVNTVWIGDWADVLMPLLRDQRTWYPLYALLLIYLVWKFRWQALPLLLLAGVTIVISDQLSSNFLKEFIGRIRPCHEPRLAGIMQLRVGYCPQSGSFTSSHAVNHFSLAALFFFTMKPWFRQWRYLLFVWAAAICYAQVYVGVHYPGDVLAGGILGILIGGMIAWLFRWYFNFGAPKRKARVG